MYSIGVMAMPINFKYKDVFLKGKPQHDRFDSFRIKHPEMNTGRRAKIFSPFDALKGFNESVASKNIVYERMKVISQEDQEELNRRLQILRNLTWNSRMARKNKVQVTVVHYVVCSDKNNEAYGKRGLYKKTSGTCWGIDSELTNTILVDTERIALKNIYKIESVEGLFEENVYDDDSWVEYDM